MNDAKDISFTKEAVTGILTQYNKEVITEYRKAKEKRRLVDGAKDYLSKRLLQTAIPFRKKDGSVDSRNKKHRRIAQRFDEKRPFENKVRLSNLLMLNLLGIKVQEAGRKRKVNRSDYKYKRAKFDETLKNTRKQLNKWFVPVGYKIKFSSGENGYCELDRIKSVRYPNILK